MQIGFDAKRLFLNQTGLGNYSRFIVDSLLKHYPNEQLVLFSPKTRKNKQTEHYFTAKNVEVVNPKGFLSWPFFWFFFLKKKEWLLLFFLLKIKQRWAKMKRDTGIFFRIPAKYMTYLACITTALLMRK